MAHRFFLSGQWKPGERLKLDENEAHHCLKVLRLNNGTAIEVFNGNGLLGQATIEDQDKRAVHLVLNSAQSVPDNNALTLVFSLGKPPVTEFILKRVTEVGVRAFQPVRSLRSHPGDFKIERAEKILLEVCRQCQLLHTPELRPLVDLKTWLKNWSHPMIVADEEQREASPSYELPDLETALLIGPEGGWDPEEIKLFQQHKPQFLGLGPTRLRSETAALVGTVLAKQWIKYG